MTSYSDYKELWKRYQTEGLKRGISISRYCENNGIVYRHFEKWYKSYYKQRAYQINIVNKPEESNEVVQESSQELQAAPTSSSSIILKIEIELENGLSYNKSNISYAELYSTLKKLEALCLA